MSLSKLLYSIAFITACTQFAAMPLCGMQHFRALGARAAKATQSKMFLAASALVTGGLLYYKYSNFLNPQTTHTAQQFLPPVTNGHVSVKNERTSDEERARINQLLDQHADDIAVMFYNNTMAREDRERKTGARYVTDHAIVEFPWLPGYLIKTNPSRIGGAQVFLNCIEKYNLKHVTVPEKWLYKIPASINTQGAFFKDGFLVVVKKIEHKDEAACVINLAQAQDLCCVLRNTQYQGRYYSDIKPENLFQTPDGRFVFIDTEDGSFLGTKPAMIYCSMMRLADDKVSQFIDQQLAQVEPEFYIDYVLQHNIELLALAARRSGCKKENACELVKKNLQHYVASLNKQARAKYEESVKASVDYNYKQHKSDPEALSAKQRQLIKTIFTPGVYIKSEDCRKYYALLAKNDWNYHVII